MARHSDVLRKAVKDGKTIEVDDCFADEVLYRPRPWAKPGDKRPWLLAGKPDESCFRFRSGEVRVRRD
jgi:hypothetical protein